MTLPCCSPTRYSFLPHGGYSLIPTVLTTMAWIAAMFQDNCSYASTTDATVISNLTNGNEATVPRLTLGFMAYTIPSAETNTELFDWYDVCLPYPDETWESGPDWTWQFARVCSFLSLVLGGGATFYLWSSTCCRFQKSSWWWAGAEVALAAFFEALSFVWLANGTICRNNGTQSCELHYGAKADIMATVFWAAAAVAVFAYFPTPQGVEAEEEQRDGVMVGDDHDLALEERGAPATNGESTTTEIEMAAKPNGSVSGEHAKEEAPLQDVQIT